MAEAKRKPKATRTRSVSKSTKGKSKATPEKSKKLTQFVLGSLTNDTFTNGVRAMDDAGVFRLSSAEGGTWEETGLPDVGDILISGDGVRATVTNINNTTQVDVETEAEEELFRSAFENPAPFYQGTPSEPGDSVDPGNPPSPGEGDPVNPDDSDTPTEPGNVLFIKNNGGLCISVHDRRFRVHLHPQETSCVEYVPQDVIERILSQYPFLEPIR